MPLPRQVHSSINSVTDTGVVASAASIVLMWNSPGAMALQAVRLALCLAVRNVAEQKREFESEFWRAVLNDKANTMAVMGFINIASAVAAFFSDNPDKFVAWAAPLLFLSSGVANLIAGTSERIYKWRARKAFGEAAQKEAMPVELTLEQQANMPFLMRDPSLLWLPGMALVSALAWPAAWPLMAASVYWSLHNRKHEPALRPKWTHSPVLWQGAGSFVGGLFSLAAGVGGAKYGIALVGFGLGCASYEARHYKGGVVEFFSGLRSAPKPAV